MACASIPRCTAGKQHYLDASVAYKRAVLNAIDYLAKFGYTKEQVRKRDRRYVTVPTRAPCCRHCPPQPSSLATHPTTRLLGHRVQCGGPRHSPVAMGHASLTRSAPLPQVYLLLSCCPCEGRISGIVDVPNAVATLAIPTAIFDQVWRMHALAIPRAWRTCVWLTRVA